MKWLWIGGNSKSEFEKVSKLSRKWMLWLFRDYIFPLIYSHFYCTDSEVYKNKALFFRKPIWTTIQELVTNESIQFKSIHWVRIRNFILKYINFLERGFKNH